MLILGSNLTPILKANVLRAFIYRLTFENGYPKKNPCGARVPAITDDQWIAEHAFHVLKNGSRLMQNRHYAEPAYLAA